MSTCRVCHVHCSADARRALNDVISRTWSVTYLEAFNTCTSLQARETDMLPQCLCTKCSLDLQSAYAFLRRAREADAQLRNLLKKAETDTDHGPTVPSDPLQSTPYDVVVIAANHIDSHTDWWCTTDDGSDDDEDDSRPLKYLLDEGRAKIRPDDELQKATEIEPSPSTSFTSFVDESVDNDCSNLPANGRYLKLSPTGDQIFPQGQYQCKTCCKNYFTLTGFKAHNEIHLPKSTISKTKRPRGPNKKTRKRSKASVDGTEKENIVDSESVLDDRMEVEESNARTKDTAIALQRPKGKPAKPKKLFPCHVCGKHMISASKLRYHMVMHTGEKDYLCTMCPKAYSTIYALKHHIRTHTGERPYECKFCGDKFLRPTTLKSHMRRHTGERPYGCSICGKRFIQHSSMTTHMKLNHMAKTIQCPHCDKKYARQTDLNTHLLSHTGNKPFSCSLCPSRFIRQANLNKHMNQQHLGRANPAKSPAAKTKKRSNPKPTPKDEPPFNESSLVDSKNTSTDSRSPNDIEVPLHVANGPNLDNKESHGNEMAKTPLCFVKSSTMAYPTGINSSSEAATIRTLDEPNCLEDMNRWNWPNHS